MTNKNKTNKIQSKEKKNLKNLEKKKPLLLDEAYWCCSKLFYLHKRVKREYQLTRQNNKVQ
jgi:LAS superfamily LD-carboxypeptidase LdcB